MAITGHASYSTTMAYFLSHWDEVNTELGAGGPLVLTVGTTRTDLSGWRDQLVGFAASIVDRDNDVEITSGFLQASRGALIGRVAAFNRKMRGTLKATPYAKALPKVPTVTAGEGKILKPLNDMKSLWGKVNGATIPGFTPPLLIPDDDYDLATFTTELDALKAYYEQLPDEEQEAKLERGRRDAVEKLAYAAMRDYRAKVIGDFAEDHPLVLSLPLLTPLPGHTPATVTLTAVWDDMANELVLTWTLSADPSLADYQIRMTPGATYDTDTDSTIGSLVAGTTPLEFRTIAGLANSGDTASYKVYVVLTTGNEAGSNTVTFTRP